MAKDQISKELRAPVAEIFMDVANTLKGLDQLHRKGVKGIDRFAIAKSINGSVKGASTVTDFLSYFQIESVDLLLRLKRIFIADDMGVGKTAQAIGGKLEIENRTKRRVRTYVICPNSAMDVVWSPRINEYCTKDRRGKILIARNYSDKEIKEISNADWIILNWEALARTGNQKHGPAKFFKALLAQMQSDTARGVTCYVVFDEVHNAKSFEEEKQLSANVISLAKATEYLCCLSGTPIPNWLKDIFMAMAILRPDLFNYDPRQAAAAFREDPGIIRAVFKSCSLRRTQAQVEKLPPLSEEINWVRISPEQKRIYDYIYGDYTLPGGQKLMLLKKALLDPRLINPKYLGPLAPHAKNVEPSKYMTLDQIVNDVCVKKNEKIVIFSPLFREGVLDVLEKRYAHLGVVRLDGSVSSKNGERKRLIDRFQKDSSIRVCLANDVVVEGISLTAAIRVQFIDNPYDPGSRDQFKTRVHRRGQKKPVTVGTCAVKGTVDEGTIEFLRLKTEAIRILIEDGQMPDSHLLDTLVSANGSQVHQKYLYSPQQKLAMLASQLAGKGYKMILEGLTKNDGEFARQYAENYVKEWKGSLSYNVAQACKRVIIGLEQKAGKQFGKMLDVGGAFGVLSHIMERSMTVTDINPKHLKTSFYRSKIKKLGNKFHLLPFHDLAKGWTGTFDIACAALALHQCSGKGKESERVAAIREMHRVLKDDGVAIIALPLHTVGSSYEDFLKGITKIGFKIDSRLTGVLESVEPVEVGLKVLFIVARKQAAKKSNVSLELACDAKTVGGKSEKIYSIRRSGVVTVFTINNKLLP